MKRNSFSVIRIASLMALIVIVGISAGCQDEGRVRQLEGKVAKLEGKLDDMAAILTEVMDTNRHYIAVMEGLATEYRINSQAMKASLSALNDSLATNSTAVDVPQPIGVSARRGVTAEAYKKAQSETQAAGGVLYGKVIQRIDEGLLVDASVLREMAADRIERGLPVDGILPPAPNGKTAPNQVTGTILVTDLAQAKSMADGDKFSAIVYPAGQFQYEAASGGRRTVRRYTADLTKATAVALRATP